MSDEDTIKHLRQRVETLTRANEILQAQRDELRRIFERPLVTHEPVMTQDEALAYWRRRTGQPATPEA